MKDKLFYFLFRFFGFFVALLPHRCLFFLGKITGSLAYFLHRPFRKKALVNLAIAYGNTKTEKERKIIARRSFQNLMITMLEFFILKGKRGHLSELVTLEHSPAVETLLEKGQGVVFLTGHQANWEIPFLALTARFPGIAIGRPINNPHLYRYVLSVREMNGGKIVMPKSAIKAGLKAIERGEFLGIVGDQAYPESPYSYPLFGTRAWTTSTPALLAYKQGAPLVVGTTKRIGTHYYVKGSEPIWPDLNRSVKEEVPRMMDAAMAILEKGIKETPEQWMWVHDRWKQQEVDHVKRSCRFGFVLVVFPQNYAPFLELLPLLRAIYTRSFLIFYVPKGCQIPLPDVEVHEYSSENELYVRDYRIQLVLDFYGLTSLRRHFRKLGAFKTLFLPTPSPELLKKTLVKPECLTTVTT